jgi:hypothetical protein
MKRLLLTTIFTYTTINFVPPSLALFVDRPDFFERGNEQFEQEIERLERQAPEPVLSIEREEQSWQHFVSQEGGFSIWAPRGTITAETKTLETEVGTIEFQVLATNPQSSRFVVAYSEEELTAAQLENPEAILAGLRERIVNNTAFELIDEQPITYGEYPGRQLRLQDSEETITFRVYLIDEKVYVLGASQLEEGELSPAASAFFNSFESIE